MKPTMNNSTKQSTINNYIKQVQKPEPTSLIKPTIGVKLKLDIGDRIKVIKFKNL